MVDAEVFPGSEETGLDLVNDEEDAVFVAYFTEVVEECRGTGHIATT